MPPPTRLEAWVSPWNRGARRATLFGILAATVYGNPGISLTPESSGSPVADRVLGQSSFSATGRNRIDGLGFARPWAVAIDTSAVPNRLYVADKVNNRVLAWRDSTSVRRGRPADLVLGQPDFASAACNGAGIGPQTLCLDEGFDTGLAVDQAGNLYVSDGGNRRILEYDAPFGNDAVADRVIGQRDFASRIEGCHRLEGYCQPGQLALDGAGNLFVADYFRILEYDRPLATDLRPDRTFGESRDGGECDPGEVCVLYVGGIAVDAAGDLFVSDYALQAVLLYDQPLVRDDQPDRVIGRTDLSVLDRSCADVPSASTVCRPRQLTVDSEGNLYVVDNGNGRVLFFRAPLTSDGVADGVLGTDGTFAAGGDCARAPSESSLCSPRGVAVDVAGNVYVGDENNQRVLRFDRPFASGGDAMADAVWGQADFQHRSYNRIDARGLASPSAVAVDRSAAPNRLWVMDSDNQRVLGWRDAEGFASGAPADLVLGQPDPYTGGCNTGGLSARGLCTGTALDLRGGLAVDAHGNLFVADSQNHRVLEFDDPFDGDAVADRVYGQPGFSTGVCNLGGVGAGTLCAPAGLAVDAEETLYIADSGNNRVVVYRDALRETRMAERVFGQEGSFRAVGCAERPSAGSLCEPRAVALDGRGDLYVADRVGNRVLRFGKPLSGDLRADEVLGQRGRFDTDASGCGAELRPREDSLCSPVGLAFDGSGRLWVAVAGLDRAVRFRGLGRRATVDRMIGESGAESPSAATLLGPRDLALDDVGDLFVADGGNHRVLSYDRP